MCGNKQCGQNKCYYARAGPAQFPGNLAGLHSSHAMLPDGEGWSTWTYYRKGININAIRRKNKWGKWRAGLLVNVTGEGTWTNCLIYSLLSYESVEGWVPECGESRPTWISLWQKLYGRRRIIRKKDMYLFPCTHIAQVLIGVILLCLQ
jgi:hypothetical protein